MIEILLAILIVVVTISIGIIIFGTLFGLSWDLALLYSIYIFTTLGPAPVETNTWWQTWILGLYSLISTTIFVGVIAFLIGTFIIARYIQSELEE